MKEIGVLFDEAHTYDKWGLRLLRITIGPPEPKSILVDIEGGDGVLDLSTALTGDMAYNTRKLELSFDAPDCDYYKWPGLVSEIMDELHGRRKKIILDNDPGYYYDGLVTVENEKTNAVFAEITITAQCHPYKMERSSSLEDWLWDPFNFETGIIREYKDLAVSGVLEIWIEGSRKPVSPKIVISSDEDIRLGVYRYSTNSWQWWDLKNGTNVVPGLIVRKEKYRFRFEGTGVVSIDYKGGRL